MTSAMLTQYPDSTRLYALLQGHVGLDRAHLLLTAGADAALRALAQAFVAPGERVAVLAPSYQMYPVHTRIVGGTPEPVSIREDLTVDVNELTDAALRSRMLWLANPNQPTGTLLSRNVLLGLVRELRDTGTLVVIDEAYYPFGDQTMLADVAATDNLVVIRSFSKAWGLAGVRLGFVAAPPAVITALFTVRHSFDINAFAIAAGEWCLRHPQHATDYVAIAERGAALVRGVADRYGLETPKCAGNFQLVRVGPRYDPEDIRAACGSAGYAISVPDQRGPLRGYVRITTGPSEVLGPFSAVLDRVLSERRTEIGG
ncbi:MAG: histidinol-phosphate transaminase [Vicinamibacterales bacterium]